MCHVLINKVTFNNYDQLLEIYYSNLFCDNKCVVLQGTKTFISDNACLNLNDMTKSSSNRNFWNLQLVTELTK